MTGYVLNNNALEWIHNALNPLVDICDQPLSIGLDILPLVTLVANSKNSYKRKLEFFGFNLMNTYYKIYKSMH